MQPIQIVQSSQQVSPQQDETYFFTPVQVKLMADKQIKEILLKWGLNQTLVLASFRFNHAFEQRNAARFLEDLFNNPNVRYLVNGLHYPQGNISNLKFTKLRCQQTTLDMFDRLTEQRIVIKDRIQGTFEDNFQGIEINSLLRQALLKQQSEHFCLYSEKERDELVFKLFQLLALGGSMNQYEDLLTPYLDWTKKFYKSLVSVRKDAETSDIFIQSYCFKINKIEKTYEPSYNPQDVLYVIVNPSSRIVNVVYNKWVKFW